MINFNINNNIPTVAADASDLTSPVAGGNSESAPTATPPTMLPPDAVLNNAGFTDWINQQSGFGPAGNSWSNDHGIIIIGGAGDGSGFGPAGNSWSNDHGIIIVGG